MAEPTCTTEAPHTIGKTYATLTGVLVDDGGHACVYRFWYMDSKRIRYTWPEGREILTWQTTPWQSAGAPGSTFSAVITVPRPHNSYDYFAQVANEDGQDNGLTLHFWFRWKSPPHDGSPFLTHNVTIVGPWDTWVITMHTDISCRLTLHVDNNVPFRKTGEHFKRGVVYMHTPLTFFTPKWALEQQETGDSLVHTFLWSCKTPYGRYTIQATGTVDGRLSPSKSPFFYFACKPAPPPVETSDQCTRDFSEGGYCQWWNANSQTFCPDHDYTLIGISLRLMQNDILRKGPYRVYVRRRTGDCWASPVLWTTFEWAQSLPPPHSRAWTYYPVSGVPVTAGVTYDIAIVCQPGWTYWNGSEWKPGDQYMGIKYWRAGLPDCYPRGTGWYNCNFRDSSGSWRDKGDDINFICWQQPA
ncbi:hypothetical protein ES708_11058 [subsurface metagenome]